LIKYCQRSGETKQKELRKRAILRTWEGEIVLTCTKVQEVLPQKAALAKG
jgi:hypothetical protein